MRTGPPFRGVPSPTACQTSTAHSVDTTALRIRRTRSRARRLASSSPVGPERSFAVPPSRSPVSPSRSLAFPSIRRSAVPQSSNRF